MEQYDLTKDFYFVNVRNNKEKNVYYLSNGEDFQIGDAVIVENPFGNEFGVINSNKISASIVSEEDVRKIVRRATKEDRDTHQANLDAEQAVRKDVVNSVNKFELNMHVVDIKYNFDRSKILISYISEERVDFRELLKDLAFVLKCRIELRQIGSRDRAALIGGIGVCGLPLCCTTFLKEFDGISINMAKNQMLSLNIAKISGQCGKLLCCLKYEDDMYSEIKQKHPKVGFRIRYNGGEYKIDSINYISETAKLVNEDGEVEFVSLSDIEKSK